MSARGKLFKISMWFMALLLAAFVAGCGGGGGGETVAAAPADPGPGAPVDPGPGTPVPPVAGAPTVPGAGTGVGGLGQGPAPVNLGNATFFAIVAQSAITNVFPSTVSGDVGLSPAAGTFIGLTCAEVNGVIMAVDAAGPLPCSQSNADFMTSVVADKGIAYTDAQGRAADYTEVGAGNIGGMTLPPAVYKWGTGVLIPTNVTLTGGPNDVWIFQIAQGLTVSSGVQVILAGGALPQNVYWATFGVADLGTSSQFRGVILSQTSIVMRTHALNFGKLLAGTAVTLDQNIVTQ